MPYNVLDPSTAEAALVTTIGEPLTSVGMTLAELESELDALLAGRPDVDSPRLQLWINQGYVQICTDLQIDELKGSIGIVTVGDQMQYLLPSAVFTTLGAAIVDADRYPFFGGRPLDKIDLSSYRTAENASGDVQAYFRHGQQIILWPTPDTDALTIALDFRVRPDFLVDPTDSPLIGIEWHEAILLCARSKAFGALLEFDKEAIANNAYIKHIRMKLDREASEQENMVPRSSMPKTKKMLYRGRHIPDLEP